MVSAYHFMVPHGGPGALRLGTWAAEAGPNGRPPREHTILRPVRATSAYHLSVSESQSQLRWKMAVTCIKQYMLIQCT